MGTALDKLIRALAEPLAEEQGLYLFDLQIGGGKRLTLRLRVERKSKQSLTDGVTIAECAVFSRRLEHLLDLEDAVPTEYALEVSSPGLERELKTPRHFEGAIGEWVRAQVESEKGPVTVEGTLIEAGPEKIVLQGEKTCVEQALRAVRRAQTIYRA